MEHTNTLLDDMAQYAREHGEVIPEKYAFNNNEEGGDAASVNSTKTTYSLIRDKCKINLTDYIISRSNGTSYVEWHKENGWKIEVYIDDKLALKAERSLGGVSGWCGILSSGNSKIDPTTWKLSKQDITLDDIKNIFDKVVRQSS